VSGSDRRWDDEEGAAAFDGRLTRRGLLRGAAAAGLAAGASGILAACGGGGKATPATTTAGGTGASTTATAEAAGQPKYGGRLRVGHVGGGQGESFNPGRGSTFIDSSRMYNLYDPLTRVNERNEDEPGLALEWNANADSTVWEIKLRPDVVWHNGKDFTADDVIYTFRSMGDPNHVGHSAVTNIELADLKKLDDLTLRVPLKGPNARPWDSFVFFPNVVIQDGTTDFSKPVGTGAFMFESFTVGERSRCKKNPNYWEEGKPYVDEWEDISIDDDTARLNALRSGEIDAMSQLPYLLAKVQKEQGQIQVIDAPSPSIHVILMAVDLDPFTDKRVRQAFRLIADRQALIDGALAGFGTLGNDLAGKGLPYFADDLPAREQDLEQAKSLLKAAGQEDLRVTLHTSKIVPGFVEAATLFAEQARGAGVTIDLKQEPANAYFDTSLLYTKLNFAQSQWPVTSLGQWYDQSLLSDAVWNETHWRDPTFDKMIGDAEGATDEATATERWHKAQEIQYEEGGYIVWVNVDIVDAAATNLKGIKPSPFFNLDGFAYRNFWFA
jgi:peptide/nickel transport system substrate-binding protein